MNIKKNKKKWLISIIVPVYKVARELPRCMDSLLSQTYENIEVILVDDGSPDECPAICEAYKKKDTRVNVIHKTNGGLSDARNAGLDQATGDYLLFVDSDDCISLDTCEAFVEYLENADCAVDIIAGDYLEIRKDKQIAWSRPSLVTGKCYSPKEFILETAPYNQMYCLAVLNLYRNAFIQEHNLRFKKGILHEDMEWTPRCLLAADNILYIQKTFYQYIIRDGSITQNKNHEKHIADSIEIYQTWLNSFSEIKDEQLRECLLGFLSKCYITTCAKYAITRKKRIEDLNLNFFVKYGFNTKEKVRGMLFGFFPNIYILIYQKLFI